MSWRRPSKRPTRPPAPEEVDQARLALRPVEDVRLRDLDHRQPTAVGIEGVALPGHLRVAGQQLLAGGQPLVARCDVWKAHDSLLAMGEVDKVSDSIERWLEGARGKTLWTVTE